VLVVDPASGSLLWIESQFGVRLAPLYFAAGADHEE